MRMSILSKLTVFMRIGQDIENAVVNVGHERNGNAAGADNPMEYLSSWSDHVLSWTAPKPYPVLTIRYEDMLAKPKKEFRRVLSHIGMPVDAARLAQAIEFSSFKELSSQEDQNGFVEKSIQSERFFNKGQSGQWEHDLPSDLAEQMKKNHRKVMKKFGYL